MLDSEQAIAEAVHACFICPIAKNIQKRVIVRGTSSTPQFMFVGEAPGKMEDKHGEPFVGAAGVVLQAAINKAKLTSYAIVNLIKCKPIANFQPYEPEFDSYVANCSPFIEAQIEVYKPMTIITLGVIAGKYFLKRDINLTTEHGRYHRAKARPPIFTTYHPGVRDQEKRDTLVKDLCGL